MAKLGQFHNTSKKYGNKLSDILISQNIVAQAFKQCQTK